MADEDMTPQNDIDGGVEQEATAAQAATTEEQSAEAQQLPQRPDSIFGGAKDAAEPQAGEPITPESYGDFAVPEGMVVDEEVMGEFRARAAAAGVPKDAAQGLLDLHSQMLLKQQNGYVQQMHDWRQELETDSHYGGQNMQATFKDALRGLDKFDRFGLKQELIANGYENNPKVIKFLAEVGRAFKDDNIVTGRDKPPAAKESLRDALWPDEVMPKL